MPEPAGTYRGWRGATRSVNPPPYGGRAGESPDRMAGNGAMRIYSTGAAMTTAAIADGVVAVDTQLSGGNYAVRTAKLVRLPDGGVAVGAGLFRTAYAGLKWLAEGERGDPPEIEGATIAIVRPDASIWLADEGWPAFPLLERTYALGCGADLARMAMAQGRSPVEAVADACELDAASSAPILSMSVEPVQFSPAQAHEVKRGKRR